MMATPRVGDRVEWDNWLLGRLNGKLIAHEKADEGYIAVVEVPTGVVVNVDAYAIRKAAR